MSDKFKYLAKDSIMKKIGTKSFKIVNILLCVIIIGLMNLDNIVKSFGGKFNEQVKILVIDEAEIYSELEKTILDNNFLDSYNAKIVKSNEKIDILKENIIKEKSTDIILNIKRDKENIFNIDFLSYEYIDQILYQNILNALNDIKVKKAIENSNINQTFLNKIYEKVNINRILLNEDLDENQELIEKMGGIIIIVFIVPFFVLIVFIVQMIGAEINEEKRTKSMEVIISSVPAKIHFLSKLVAANVFAILQGALLIIYVIVGFIIRNLSSPLGNIATTSGIEAGTINNYIKLFIESDVASRLFVGIPFFILLIILSFFAYSLFIGVLASITTSMEDYQQIQTPVMIFLMIGYYLAIYASVYQGSIFIKIASYIPFISGILAPVMYSLGQISIYGLMISIILLGITCYLLYKYGLKIYKEGILNYQSNNLWKKMFKSLKN